MAVLDTDNPFFNYAVSLVKDMPGQVALVMGLMIFMAISEGASLLLLIPMLLFYYRPSKACSETLTMSEKT